MVPPCSKTGVPFWTPFFGTCDCFLIILWKKVGPFWIPFFGSVGPIFWAEWGVPVQRCWNPYVGTCQTARVHSKSRIASTKKPGVTNMHNAQDLIPSDPQKVNTSSFT